MCQELLVKFYRAVIESILTLSFTVWYNSATEEDRDRLRRMVRTASKIAGCDLPTLDSLYLVRMTKRAQRIADDPSHPANILFEMLSSDK